MLRNNGDTIAARLVDFGNTVDATVEKIATLRESDAAAPAQAVFCLMEGSRRLDQWKVHTRLVCTGRSDHGLLVREAGWLAEEVHRVEVKVQHREGGVVWVRPRNTCKLLDMVQNKLERAHGRRQLTALKEVRDGQECVAIYWWDKLPHRCVVEKVQEGSYAVRFLDWGNREEVDEVLGPLPELMGMGGLAWPVRLMEEQQLERGDILLLDIVRGRAVFSTSGAEKLAVNSREQAAEKTARRSADVTATSKVLPTIADTTDVVVGDTEIQQMILDECKSNKCSRAKSTWECGRSLLTPVRDLIPRCRAASAGPSYIAGLLIEKKVKVPTKPKFCKLSKGEQARIQNLQNVAFLRFTFPKSLKAKNSKTGKPCGPGQVNNSARVLRSASVVNSKNSKEETDSARVSRSPTVTTGVPKSVKVTSSTTMVSKSSKVAKQQKVLKRVKETKPKVLVQVEGIEEKKSHEETGQRKNERCRGVKLVYAKPLKVRDLPAIHHCTLIDSHIKSSKPARRQASPSCSWWTRCSRWTWTRAEPGQTRKGKATLGNSERWEVIRDEMREKIKRQKKQAAARKERLKKQTAASKERLGKLTAASNEGLGRQAAVNKKRLEEQAAASKKGLGKQAAASKEIREKQAKQERQESGGKENTNKQAVTKRFDGKKEVKQREVPTADLASADTRRSLLTSIGCVERKPGPATSLLKPVEARPTTISSLGVSNSGSGIITGFNDGIVKLWSRQEQSSHGLHIVRSFKASNSGRGITAVALGSTCALTGTVQGMVKHFQLEDGSVQPLGHGLQGAVHSLSMAMAGVMVMCATRGGFTVLDRRTRQPVVRRVVSEIDQVALSSTGTMLAVASKKVMLWDLRASRSLELGTIPGTVTSMAFSRDGTCLAAGSNEGCVCTWNTDQQEAGTCNNNMSSLYNGLGAVTSLAFSECGTLFAGAQDGALSRILVKNSSSSIQTMVVQGWEDCVVRGLGALAGEDAMLLVTGRTEPSTATVQVKVEDAAEDGQNEKHDDVEMGQNVAGAEEGHEEQRQDHNATVTGHRSVSLQVGKVFSSCDEVTKFVQDYQFETKCAFSTRSSTKAKVGGLKWECKHGEQRRSRSKNIRPDQSTVKLGCKAHIRFYKRADGTFKLTAFNEEHTNHDVSEQIYQQDTAKIGENRDELIGTLMEGRSKAGQIAKVLEDRYGQRYTSKQVRYRMIKLLGNRRDNAKLEELLNTVLAEGGSVQMMKDEEGEVRVLTISTSAMLSAFRGSNPSVCNVDTTFKFEESGYKLNAVLYLNPVTGKGEVVQFAFLADERDSAYDFCHRSFKQLCFRDPPVLIIDKVICS